MKRRSGAYGTSRRRPPIGTAGRMPQKPRASDARMAWSLRRLTCLRMGAGFHALGHVPCREQRRLFARSAASVGESVHYRLYACIHWRDRYPPLALFPGPWVRSNRYRLRSFVRRGKVSRCGHLCDMPRPFMRRVHSYRANIHQQLMLDIVEDKSYGDPMREVAHATKSKRVGHSLRGGGSAPVSRAGAGRVVASPCAFCARQPRGETPSGFPSLRTGLAWRQRDESAMAC